jgi:hypothetical protein
MLCTMQSLLIISVKKICSRIVFTEIIFLSYYQWIRDVVYYHADNKLFVKIYLT